MKPIDILFVTKPGPWLDAVLNILNVRLPQPPTFYPVATGLSALALLREFQPRLTLIALDDSTAALLELIQQLRQSVPTGRCLVIARTQMEADYVRLAGVDESLLYGFSAEQLAATVGQLLEYPVWPRV